MDIEEGLKKINGIVEVEVEGFFTERYINLCRINNIKIWNIKTIGAGIVRFSIAINDFKKLRKITKKTKCKVKILHKKGVYFKMFKYRKRKLAFLLLAICVILCVFLNTFIWNIEITGNTYIETQDVYDALKEAGVAVGKNKIGLKTKSIVMALRVALPDIAWVGVDFDGTNVYVSIVEKTKLEDEQETAVGDILSDKAGIIEKIVVENGTAISSVGDYVEAGRILIEGKVYSETLGVKDVSAKGTVTLKTEYTYSNDYYYVVEEKEYTGKTKYSIGISINEKENYINYLDKSLNYDIIKSGKDITLFGIKFSFLLYKFNEYNLTYTTLSKEELLTKAKNDSYEYIQNEVLPNTTNANILSTETIIDSEDDEKISVRVIYTLTEEVGYFKERE